MGDFVSSCTVLEPVSQSSQNPEIFLNLAVSYSKVQRYEDAVCAALRCLERRPDDVVAYDVLSAGYFQLKQFSQAREAGTQALCLKDARVTLTQPQWALPEGSAKAWATEVGKRNVIAFSLWGAHPRYLRGALRNLLLAPDMYPSWILRFYVDETVPRVMLDLIRTLGGEVIEHTPNAPIRERLCWRFNVANDPSVGYFLVRDVDSVFSVREVNAVHEWQSSEQWFHVIRDWWSHTDLMLAGLWGGVAGVLPNLNHLLSQYQPNTMETPNVDQWFLRDCVWTYVRHSVLTHDRCFSMPQTVRLDDDVHGHIGHNDWLNPAQQRVLQAWIERYPFLQLSDG